MCNWDGCPHGGGGDRDENKAQGCIQSVSKLGMSIEMHGSTVEQPEKH